VHINKFYQNPVECPPGGIRPGRCGPTAGSACWAPADDAAESEKFGLVWCWAGAWATKAFGGTGGWAVAWGGDDTFWEEFREGTVESSCTPKRSVDPPPGGRRTLLLLRASGSRPLNIRTELAIPNLKFIQCRFMVSTFTLFSLFCAQIELNSYMRNAHNN